MTCERIDETTGAVERAPTDPTTPMLDGDTSEWSAVTGGISPQIKSIFGRTYAEGNPTYKCLYDSTKVYFALEIPGKYRFDETENKRCAAIGTMMPIGSKAGFLNMGGCPESMENGGCPDGIIPDVCSDYVVDLGAHWELKTTAMNSEYPMNATTGSGNDLVANLDDEVAVSSFCRPDDNDSLAGNEWSGAWSHTNPVEGEMGTYKFEISRSLKTPSTVSDAQMEPGQTYDFGIAYWDPFETENGWTPSGHFLTGCSADWIKLRLSDGTPEPEEEENDSDAIDTTDTTADTTTSGAIVITTNLGGMIIASLVLLAATATIA